MGVYSDRLKKRGLRHGSGSKGGGGGLGTGHVKKGGLRHGSGSKKRGGGVLGTGQVKRGGSLLRHIRVLDIYASADPRSWTIMIIFYIKPLFEWYQYICNDLS